MRKNLALAFMLCFLATTSGFAQSPLAGKWATPRPDPPLTESARKQSVQLELDVEGATASGTLTIGGLGGTFYALKDGKVSGNRIQFRVLMGTKDPVERTYTVDLVNENTVHLSLSSLPLVSGNIQDLLLALNLTSPPPSVQQVPRIPTSIPQDAPLAGIVTDAVMATIPGVTITATNTETGVVTTTMSNESGAYAFPGLQPGKAYRVSASLPGFQTKVVPSLEVGASPVRQDLQLLLPAAAPPPPSGTTCIPQSALCSVLYRKN
jgi:hypothetical protein